MAGPHACDHLRGGLDFREKRDHGHKKWLLKPSHTGNHSHCALSTGTFQGAVSWIGKRRMAQEQASAIAGADFATNSSKKTMVNRIY